MNLKTARQNKSEKITVSSTVATFTRSKYKPNPESSISAGLAFVTCEDTIRFTLDGTTPDPTTKIGHPWYAGTPLQIEGEQNLINFKAVRESSTTDTTIYVTYF